MAQFIVPYNGELRIEAENAEAALDKAYGWRKFVMECVHERLNELDLQKVSMKPMPEVTEVNAAWLENQRLRTKLRSEWEYTSRLVPVTTGSRVFFTHRIAVRPVSKQENASKVQSEGDPKDYPGVLQEDYDDMLG